MLDWEIEAVDVGMLSMYFEASEDRIFKIKPSLKDIHQSSGMNVPGYQHACMFYI